MELRDIDNTLKFLDRVKVKGVAENQEYFMTIQALLQEKNRLTEGLLERRKEAKKPLKAVDGKKPDA